MHILISNDDGVYARGIQVLAKHLQLISQITVIAPDRNRSCASNSLTLEVPLRVMITEHGYMSVSGTPTDCVHIAITDVLPQKPDMVVTGINAGSNLSDDVLYSGTVSAAMESRFLGVPAIAVSLVPCGHNELTHYETAAKVASKLVLQLKANPLPFDTILNVNVPDIPMEEVRGIQVTRLGTRHVAEPSIPSVDPRGQRVYWIGPAGPQSDAGPGTDFHAINSNYVSITPLHCDLTHYEVFDQLYTWSKDLVVHNT